MTHRAAAFLLLLLLLAPHAAAHENNAEAIEARLRKDAEVLASDALQGRGLGTEGLDEAAEYIAAEFQRLGLNTELFDGTPFQKFKVKTDSRLIEDKPNHLALIGPKADGKPIEAGEIARPLAVGGSAEVTAPLVFAGYGITAPDIGYDDYADLDVKGKVVVLVRREPQQKDKDSKFNGQRSSRHAYFTTKVENAANQGAAGVIIVNDRHTLLDAKAQREAAVEKARQAVVELAVKFAEAKNDEQQKADPTAFAEQMAKLADNLRQARASLEQSTDQIPSFTGAGDSDKYPEMPVFFARRSVVEPIIEHALGKSLEQLEQEIDGDLTPRSGPLDQYQGNLAAHIERQEIEIRNVIASLEGEGPHADETIVIGAHYDHLGLGGRGSLAPWTREIHNGADDNASGTVAMLEIARHFATQEKKPSRRLVFMAFTGEERGLWGSAHYARNPRFALEDTVAMYNLDMVGRLTDGKLKVQGTGTAKEFNELVERLNEKYEFQLDKDPSGFGPSDHTSFYRQKVPVLHLFTGLHNDYHRPSDDVDKLNLEGMRKIVQFAEEIVQWTLDQSERPEYQQTRRARGRR